MRYIEDSCETVHGVGQVRLKFGLDGGYIFTVPGGFLYFEDDDELNEFDERYKEGLEFIKSPRKL
jgi:hypothetical protein